jgi:hypothetical protein
MWPIALAIVSVVFNKIAHFPMSGFIPKKARFSALFLRKTVDRLIDPTYLPTSTGLCFLTREG